MFYIVLKKSFLIIAFSFCLCYPFSNITSCSSLYCLAFVIWIISSLWPIELSSLISSFFPAISSIPEWVIELFPNLWNNIQISTSYIFYFQNIVPRFVSFILYCSKLSSETLVFFWTYGFYSTNRSGIIVPRKFCIF